MELLVAKDVATLKGCSVRYIQSLVKQGNLAHENGQAVNGRPQYLIPLSALDIPLQRKWYKMRGIDPPTELIGCARRSKQDEIPNKVVKPLEFYTAEEREGIAEKEQLLQRWQAFRKKHGGSKAQADAISYARSGWISRRKR